MIDTNRNRPVLRSPILGVASFIIPLLGLVLARVVDWEFSHVSYGEPRDTEHFRIHLFLGIMLLACTIGLVVGVISLKREKYWGIAMTGSILNSIPIFYLVFTYMFFS